MAKHYTIDFYTCNENAIVYTLQYTYMIWVQTVCIYVIKDKRERAVEKRAAEL